MTSIGDARDIISLLGIISFSLGFIAAQVQTVTRNWLDLDLDHRIGRKAGPCSTNCSKEVAPCIWTAGLVEQLVLVVQNVIYMSLSTELAKSAYAGASGSMSLKVVRTGAMNLD